jgi:hypothetical protein
VGLKSGGSTPEWTHIPKDAVEGLSEAYANFYSAYTPTLVPCTPADRVKRDNARRDAEKVIRPFVKRYLQFDPVKDEDKKNMAVPIHDTKPSPIADPIAQAEGDLTFPGVHMVEIKKLRPVSGPAPSSKSDYGIKIFFGLTGESTSEHPIRLSKEPKTGRELPESVFTKKKKILFDFEGESGNTLYVCMRYENQKGREGPFGPMLKAVIP